MAGKVTRALFWLLTALFFAYNFYLWGGLAVTPTYGKQLREMASLQSPIAAAYLFIGSKLVDAAGQSDEAMKFAAERFPSVLSDTESSPLTIVPRVLAAQSASGTLFYYGAPILLVLSFVLHARRPKQIRSFGGHG
jgi:hypothetical protein